MYTCDMLNTIDNIKLDFTLFYYYINSAKIEFLIFWIGNKLSIIYIYNI